MAEPWKIREGWTDELEWILEVDGEPLDLTGMTVTMILRDCNGTLVAVQGTFAKDPDQVANPGKVAFAPHANDFAEGEAASKSPYGVEFKVVDTSSKVGYFPAERLEPIYVRPAPDA